MSDSDDDYMSDKILSQCVPEKEESLLKGQRQKHVHEVYKKRLEHTKKRSGATYKEKEAENREHGLDNPISSDNKGFQMLAKMGFKVGQSIGKTSEGIKEPIRPIMKEQKFAGVGVANKITKKRINDPEIMRKRIAKIEQTMRDFKSAKREMVQQKCLVQDMKLAQKVCEELDEKNGVPEPFQEFFWTLNSAKTRLKIDEEVDEERVEEFEENFKAKTTEHNLSFVIEYLRTKYLYCIYCAFIANDEEDLTSNCPGATRQQHDNIDGDE